MCVYVYVGVYKCVHGCVRVRAHAHTRTLATIFTAFKYKKFHNCKMFMSRNTFICICMHVCVYKCVCVCT